MAGREREKVVLVVDDNEAIRENLSECLESEGYRCWLEASADDALRRLELASRVPDVILLDLGMPGMPARRFVSLLRGTLAWAKVPVILSTAAWEHEIPPDLSVDAVLLRPFEVQRLFDLVRDVCREGASGCDSYAH
jgi:CheY-like chemotaxis protein